MRRITPQSGIYKIVNLATGDMYIGQTNNIKKRWRQHTVALNNQKHHSPKLQKDWLAYGDSQFRFEVIEIVDCQYDRNEREHVLLTGMKPVYNFDQTIGTSPLPKVGCSLDLSDYDSLTQHCLSAGITHAEAVRTAIKLFLSNP